MAPVSASVEVDAPAEQVWAVLTDWARQGEWMPLTRVRGTVNGGQGVGGGVEGWTGVGPVGFLDTMVVRGWEPNVRVAVRHTGRLVRGGGAFEIERLAGGRSRFTWSEFLDLPLGPLGRAGWPLARPLVRAALRLSLARFRRVVEASARPGR
ncbi:SRPBCC family protein [Motilibacter aurantiacus]|uniref:SRPBCC family protein n=1 Tax=Motilibacter aurantiacus TaxID=2714955 RepID=UPI00140B9A2C|nr:SRPBCC family protein [Motilibacter aurantiacus]